jgi:electron transport complex protein RnfG
MSQTPGKPVVLIAAVVVTCLVAASGLAATYAVTADRIAEQDRKAQEDSLKAAVPDAVSFEEVTDDELLAAAVEAAGEVKLGITDENGGIGNAIFRALDSSGNAIGWGMRLGSRGYGGYAQLVIGLDSSGSVTGVSVLSHAETPGLGTKVMDNKELLGRFTELSAGFTSKDVKAIDGVSGATKSTRAVRNAVAAAGAIYTEVLSKGGE